MDEYEDLKMEGFYVSPGHRTCGVTCTPLGTVYVTDPTQVYLVDLEEGEVERFAGSSYDLGQQEGPRLEVSFSDLNGIGAMADESLLIVSSSSHRVYLIQNDRVSRFAGVEKGHEDGPRLTALFNSPSRVVVLNDMIYVADCWNNCIRRIDSEGIVSTIGRAMNDYLTGPLPSSSLPYLRGLCVGNGNTLIASTSGPHRISKIDFDTQEMTFLAGSEKGYADGPGHLTKFDFPFDVAIHPINGDIFVADDDNCAIRLVKGSDNHVSTFVGHGPHTKPISFENSLGPRKKAVIPPPTGIFLTLRGDLVWTSRDAYIRFIPGVAPDRRPQFSNLPSFTQYLDDFNRSTRRITLVNGKIINLFDPLLSLWSLSSETLSTYIDMHSSNILPEAVERFICFLYGDRQESNFKQRDSETIRLLVQIWSMAADLFAGEANSIVIWCIQMLNRAFEGLKTRQLLDLGEFLQDDFARFSRASDLWFAVISPRKRSSAGLDAMQRWSLGNEARSALIEKMNDFAFHLPEDANLFKTPTDTLTSALNALSMLLSDYSHSSDAKFLKLISPDPDFTLIINKQDKFELLCHSWILYARWPYFKAMIDAGLDEAREMKAQLSQDLHPNTLIVLIRFIYADRVTPEIKAILKANPDIGAQLLENAVEYRLCEMESNSGELVPSAGFKPLFQAIKGDHARK